MIKRLVIDAAVKTSLSNGKLYQSCKYNASIETDIRKLVSMRLVVDKDEDQSKW